MGRALWGVAVLLLLGGCSDGSTRAPGEGQYLRFCASCHGGTGQGIPGLYPPLVGVDWVTGDKERLIRIVLAGMQGPMEVNGTPYNNVMPPHSFFSDEDLADVLTYIRKSWGNAADSVSAAEVERVRALVPPGLQTVEMLAQPLGTGSRASSEDAPGPAAARIDGATVYRQVCQACHQDDGQGLTGLFPPLIGTDWVLGDADRLIRIVLGGLQGEIDVQGQTYDGVMVAQAQLSDGEVAAVLTYVRQAWGNQAELVDPAQVAAIRATMTRTTPWTVEALNAASTP